VPRSRLCPAESATRWPSGCWAMRRRHARAGVGAISAPAPRIARTDRIAGRDEVGLPAAIAARTAAREGRNGAGETGARIVEVRDRAEGQRVLGRRAQSAGPWATSPACTRVTRPSRSATGCWRGSRSRTSARSRRNGSTVTYQIDCDHAADAHTSVAAAANNGRRWRKHCCRMAKRMNCSVGMKVEGSVRDERRSRAAISSSYEGSRSLRLRRLTNSRDRATR